MKYLIFIIFLFTFNILPTLAQSEYSFRDRLFFGGNFGRLQIGTITNIEISPHAGYYITPRWAAGIGFTYEYYNNKYFPYILPGQIVPGRLETHIWGGRLFTNYVIINDVNDWIPFLPNMRIFAHAEYETLSYEKKLFSNYYDTKGRELFHSFLVGGGLRFPMGKRSSMNFTVLWNLNNEINSIYGNRPVIRIGFNF